MTLDDLLDELIDIREWVDRFVKEALENLPKPSDIAEQKSHRP